MPIGRPINDLASDEVSLKVNGRTRAIKSMQWIQVAAPVIEGTEPPVLIPPPFGSNTRKAGMRVDSGAGGQTADRGSRLRR
jgi:hypothetical protein